MPAVTFAAAVNATGLCIYSSLHHHTAWLNCLQQWFALSVHIVYLHQPRWALPVALLLDDGVRQHH